MANTYDIGDQTRLSGTFTTAAGTAVDPTAVTLKIKTPSGVTTTYTYGDVGSPIVKSGTGVYYADYTILASGRHLYEWTGTGNAIASEPGHFEVRKNAISGL